MTTWLAVGPPALRITVGAEPDLDRGWLVRPFEAAEGLDGPDDILQGGLAAGVTATAARLADGFGAPLTGLQARLHAPTPLGRELQLALRPADGVARHEVQLRAGEQLLVSATVELAGHDPAPRVADLTELATVPLPPQAPQELYPRCWVCGQRASHPAAQRLTFGYHGDAIVTPWLAEPELADDAGGVDPLVVAAVLDCPGVWSAMPSLHADGWGGCLLAGIEVRHTGRAPTVEPLRVVARHDRTDGRKVRVRSALVDEDGVVFALASALHIAVPELPGAAAAG